MDEMKVIVSLKVGDRVREQSIHALVRELSGEMQARLAGKDGQVEVYGVSANRGELVNRIAYGGIKKLEYVNQLTRSGVMGAVVGRLVVNLHRLQESAQYEILSVEVDGRSFVKLQFLSEVE